MVFFTKTERFILLLGLNLALKMPISFPHYICTIHPQIAMTMTVLVWGFMGMSAMVPRAQWDMAQDREIQFGWPKPPSFWCQMSPFCYLLKSLCIWIKAGNMPKLQCVSTRKGEQLSASSLPRNSKQESNPSEVSSFTSGYTISVFPLWASVDGMLQNSSRACLVIQPCTHN